METSSSGSHRLQRSRVCTTVQYVAAVWCGVWAAAIGPHGGSAFFALVAWCLASLSAIAFGWNWLVPCVVLGFLFGVSMDNKVKGGSIESQMQETCVNVGVGTLLGLTVGIAADLIARGRRCEAEDQADCEDAAS